MQLAKQTLPSIAEQSARGSVLSLDIAVPGESLHPVNQWIQPAVLHVEGAAQSRYAT